MRVLRLLLALGAVAVLPLPAAASPNPDLRTQIGVFVDERGLPDGVDRACVVDRAVVEHPNVPLTVIGPPPPRQARAQHEENIRRIRIALAVNAAVLVCTPAPAATPSEGE